MNISKAEKALKRLKVEVKLKFLSMDAMSQFTGWHCSASKPDEDDYGWDTLYKGTGVTMEEAIIDCATDAVRVTKELLDELQS